jgi:hypothetical protein
VTGEECKAVSACTHAMYMLEKDACEFKGQKIKTAVRESSDMTGKNAGLKLALLLGAPSFLNT